MLAYLGCFLSLVCAGTAQIVSTLLNLPPSHLNDKNRFGVVQLFDYRNQDASAVDGITGGLYGIRLDNLVSGVNAFEALAAAKLHTNSSGRHQRDRYRYVCVVLASQVSLDYLYSYVESIPKMGGILGSIDLSKSMFRPLK